MNKKYCPICFLHYNEQVMIIPNDAQKDRKGIIQEKQINRCAKRKHEVQGSGLTLSGIKELDKFYKEKN
jgi:hypothetical protein